MDRMHADDDARRAVQAAGSLWSGAGSDDGVDADARDGCHVTRQGARTPGGGQRCVSDIVKRD